MDRESDAKRRQRILIDLSLEDDDTIIMKGRDNHWYRFMQDKSSELLEGDNSELLRRRAE